MIWRSMFDESCRHTMLMRLRDPAKLVRTSPRGLAIKVKLFHPAN
jgi:hypothetical protein